MDILPLQGFSFVHNQEPEPFFGIPSQIRQLHVDVILENMFKKGVKRNREYCIRAVVLMLEIYKELGNLRIHLNPIKKLKSLDVV